MKLLLCWSETKVLQGEFLACPRAPRAVVGDQAGHDSSDQDVLTPESLCEVTRKVERGLAALWA